jgi:hypothetical protein
VLYTLSIVSHRSGLLVAQLLQDLRRHMPSGSEIVLTINVPENESFLESFTDLPITIIRNSVAKGFGENHNQAFKRSSGRFFAVINPDIRLTASPFEYLAQLAGQATTGVCAPLVLSPSGNVEDSARRFPSVMRLVQRRLQKTRTSDYAPNTRGTVPVDWIAGMFLVFRREIFASINGFDTRYFMYFEDVDICRRLHKNRYQVLWASKVSVIHNAQRASHRSAQHLRWHLRSALRFLFNV